jgi:hypothetical protein
MDNPNPVPEARVSCSRTRIEFLEEMRKRLIRDADAGILNNDHDLILVHFGTQQTLPLGRLYLMELLKRFKKTCLILSRSASTQGQPFR